MWLPLGFWAQLHIWQLSGPLTPAVWLLLCHNFAGNREGSSFSSKHNKMLFSTGLYKFDPVRRVKLNKGEVAGRVAWVPSGQGCRARAPHKLCLYKLDLCNSLHQHLIQKTCQLMQSPFFVEKFMAPNLGGLCFTAKVGNILKQSKAIHSDPKAYSFDLNPITG